MCILCYKKRLEMNEWFDTVAFIRNFSMEYTQWVVVSFSSKKN